MVEKYGCWTVKELKNELRNRNAKCVGKKEALIERLSAYDRNSNFMEIGDLAKDDNEIAGLAWPPEESFGSVQESTIVPQMDIVNINEYFLQIYKEQEGMTMYAAVHRKGYNMMKENFLIALVVSNNDDFFFFRAQVNSEMTKSLTYFVKLAINLEGSIIEGSCECIAGKGTRAVCKHVATVSYAILHYKEHETWCIRKTCTDQKQTWHMPKRSKVEISPKKAEQLNLSVSSYSIKKKEMCNNMCYDPRPIKYRNNLSFIGNVRNAVVNYNSTKRRTLALSGAFTVASILGLTSDHDYMSRSLVHQFIWNRIEGTKDYLLSIEKKTRGQSCSPTWFKERSMRITASHVGSIVHMTDRRNKDMFADTIINPKRFKSLPTEWGKLNEKNAVMAYKKATTNEVVSCGLFISPQHCFLAGSPDGLVCSLTVLEVKCPYSIRHQTITPENLDYIQIKNNILSLKPSSNYYYQIQTQMYVTGRAFCDFCIWTKKDFTIISVTRNDDVINKLIIPKTMTFYNEYMVPALVKKFYSLEK